MRGILASGALVLAAVGWLAGAALWNRTGAVSRATLTARELRVEAPGEGPVRLALEWVPRDDPLDARNWLTNDRLLRLGFDLAVPPAAPEAERAYGRMLPRRGWVVFELAGEAWRTETRRRAVSVGDPGARPPTASRLVPIDAGPDWEPLAERYPPGAHLIVAAWIHVGWIGPDAGGPLVYGYIQRLDPAHVVVPPQFADRVREAARRASGEAGAQAGAPVREPAAAPLEVDLVVGRLGIPWVADVR